MNKSAIAAAILLLAAPALAAPLDDFVRDAEKGLAKTSLLEARFNQTVSVPFMDAALKSSGKFCFDIRDKKAPEIFWEYLTPDVSGFLYKDGKASFWTKDDKKTLSESEMGYLKSMTDQILQWISFDPERLRAVYNISEGQEPLSLRFEPKEKSRLFSAIVMRLSEDMTRLTRLVFEGRNGEATAIDFDVEAANKPLSEECRR